MHLLQNANTKQLIPRSLIHSLTYCKICLAVKKITKHSLWAWGKIGKTHFPKSQLHLKKIQFAGFQKLTQNGFCAMCYEANKLFPSIGDLTINNQNSGNMKL